MRAPRRPKLLLTAPHVGTFIRADVFPAGLTVKEAARHLATVIDAYIKDRRPIPGPSTAAAKHHVRPTHR